MVIKLLVSLNVIVVSVASCESEKYGLRGIYDLPRLNRRKLNFLCTSFDATL